MQEPEPDSTPGAISRRRFGRRAAIAVAGSAVSLPLDSQALPASDQAVVNAKYANVVRKYGDRLSPAQRVHAREILERHQRMLKRIRDFALENSDAPATGLRLFPSDLAETRD